MKVKDKKFFKGTKVPFSFLINYIKNGYTVTDFINSYPWINKKEVIKHLDKIEKEHTNIKYAAQI